MAYRRLFLLVEGVDEERFIEAVLVPHVRQRYDHVKVWTYAQQSPKKTRQVIDSILAMNADYLFLRDFDQGPCIIARKEAVQEQYRRLDAERIVIVKEEIESWYAAGLSEEAADQLGIKKLRRTDDLTKEQFNQIMPERIDSRIVFLQELLRRFDLEMARQKNASFAYFCRKHL